MQTVDHDVRVSRMVERFDILVELDAIGRELIALEAQFGARPEIQASRAWQQRQCLALIAQFVAQMLPSHTETVQ